MAESDDWCLIESDPGVFTELIKEFGAEGLQCEEVYDLSDTSSVSDALGLIFLFKWEGNAIPGGTPVQGEKLRSIFFAEQIIRNACATQAIVNVLLNLPTNTVGLGETLSVFKSFVSDFDSKMKGSALTNCDKLRTAHNSFTSPHVYEVDDNKSASSKDAYHFIGYVPIDGSVYELDGLKSAPIDHGSVPQGTSWIDTIKPVIANRMGVCVDGRFNLMAIVPNRLQLYEKQLAELTVVPESNDEMINQLKRSIDIERAKAASQRTENTRRRHNYLPFIIEIIKILADKGRLVDVVQKAKEKSKESDIRA